MDRSRIHQLSQQYVDGTLLPAEWEELKRYLLQGENHPEFEAVLANALVEEEYEQVDPVIFDRVLQNVLTAEMPVPVQSGRRIPWQPKWRWVAASLLLALGIGTWLWLANRKTATTTFVAQSIPDLQPGKEGAVLTLADGAQVLLDTISNSTVALQNGVTAKVVNGQLLYEGKAHAAVYNTMSTPKGRQFHMTLPDGTGVWLNAASAIRYPTVFNESERIVEVSGEVYFEVARNSKQPFKVNIAGKGMVEVLGTHFNVNAYDDEASINTTLLEGAVRVSRGLMGAGKVFSADAGSSVLLIPGQQAQIQPTSSGVKEKIKIITTNPAHVIAWKNGLFSFHDASLEEVMRQLARWYNLNIVYQHKKKDIRFGGEMRRDLKLSNMLKALEGYNVRFKMEGPDTLVVLD